MKVSKEKIKVICKEYGIKNYTINLDKSIDVDGGVNLYKRNLTELPLKFRNVSGHFNCQCNNLTTLKSAPEYVGGDFVCTDNHIKTLEGAPKYIKGIFYYSHNPIFEKMGVFDYNNYMRKITRSKKLAELLK